MRGYSSKTMPKKSFIASFIALIQIGVVSCGFSQTAATLALLVNDNSQASKKVANYYAKWRNIPARNIVCLNLPERFINHKNEISLADFKEKIWEPANRILSARGLNERILSWVYSVDFPVAISSSPKVSLTGITFARGKLPPEKEIKEGKAFSPLFSGPFAPGSKKRPSASLNTQAAQLAENMPLPSMMLGYVRSNGNTVAEVLNYLKSGVESDSTRPKKGIYFVKTDDEQRSKPREWQFEATCAELKKRNLSAIITNKLPADAKHILGIMTGAKKIDTESLGSFAPGAMAEHLTSWAADFDKKSQTKISAWLRAGANASAGTVTEPYSIWTKFPHARFYSHYAAGCTILESFYQALASPYQALLVGEPLARPWRFPLQIQLAGLPSEPLEEKTVVYAGTKPVLSQVSFAYTFDLDGKPIAEGSGRPYLNLDPARLADGYHELGVLCRSKAPVGQGVYLRRGFSVDRKGRSLEINAMDDNGKGRVSVGYSVNGEDKPAYVQLVNKGRILSRKPYSSGEKLFFREERLGSGPNLIQVAIGYDDGMVVRSKPVEFSILLKGEADKDG